MSISRIADVVQASSVDRRISQRLQRIPCGRCYAVIEYDRGTEWSVVSTLANEHWKACPGKPHVWSARMARTPTSPPDIAIALPPPTALTHYSVPATESVSSSNNTWISSGCERKRRTLEQRKLELEQDEYAKNVTTKSVGCAGCHKEISLDKRSKYYPGLWLKHRGKCPSIEKLERAKAKVPQTLNGTRQGRHDVVDPTFGYEDVPQQGSGEGYESRGVAARKRSVTYESENPSSEDEDDDGDLPPHEPFPTLNSDFYRTQRYYDHSDEWAYRYATNDEITTNLFRGQDEPYARLGGRHLNAYPGQPRCVIRTRVEQAVSPRANFLRSTKGLSEPRKPDVPTLSWQMYDTNPILRRP